MIRTWQKIKSIPASDCVRIGNYARQRRIVTRDVILRLLHLHSKLSKRLERVKAIKYFPEKIKSKHIRHLRELILVSRRELCRLT